MEYFQISSCPAGLCETAPNAILVVLIWNLVIPRSVGECQHLDVSILKLLDRPQPRYARSKVSVFHWIICRRKLENNKEIKAIILCFSNFSDLDVPLFQPLPFHGFWPKGLWFTFAFMIHLHLQQQPFGGHSCFISTIFKGRGTARPAGNDIWLATRMDPSWSIRSFQQPPCKKTSAIKKEDKQNKSNGQFEIWGPYL